MNGFNGACQFSILGEKVDGVTLVKLDTQLLETQKAEVVAALAENAASRDKAAQDLSRQRSLQSKGYSAQQAIDDLLARQKVLAAQREKLEAQLRGVEIRLKKSTFQIFRAVATQIKVLCP